MATKKTDKPSTKALKAKVEPATAKAKADKVTDAKAEVVKVKLLRGCRAYGMSLVTTPVTVPADKAEVLIKAGVAEAV